MLNSVPAETSPTKDNSSGKVLVATAAHKNGESDETYHMTSSSQSTPNKKAREQKMILTDELCDKLGFSCGKSSSETGHPYWVFYHNILLLSTENRLTYNILVLSRGHSSAGSR